MPAGGRWARLANRASFFAGGRPSRDCPTAGILLPAGVCRTARACIFVPVAKDSPTGVGQSPVSDREFFSQCGSQNPQSL
jgi:hypothetical protein